MDTLSQEHGHTRHGGITHGHSGRHRTAQKVKCSLGFSVENVCPLLLFTSLAQMLMCTPTTKGGVGWGGGLAKIQVLLQPVCGGA